MRRAIDVPARRQDWFRTCLAIGVTYALLGMAWAQDAPATQATAPAANQTSEPAEGEAYPKPYAETVPVAVREPEAQADAPKDESDAVQLEDVVVTATKREKSVREIPQTINALSGEQLEKIGARDITDYITLIPGITLQEGMLNSDRKITIRGVGPGDGANQTTGQLIGDVPMTDPYGALVVPDLDPFDLRSVEVLKGPQGTVFGASALNGAIRYVPNTPELGEWSGRGFFDYLSVSQGESAPSYGAAVNMPVGEALAFRAMGVIQNAPGVVDNNRRNEPDSDRREKWTGRGMARWDATERLRLNLMYLKQSTEIFDLGIVDNLEGEPLSSGNRPGPSTAVVDFSVLNLDTRYAFDWAELVWQSSRLTKLQDTDIDTSGAVDAAGRAGLEYLRAFVLADIEGYVHELRLVSQDSGRWSWIGGLFMQDYAADVDVDQYVPLRAGVPLPPLPLPQLEDLINERGISAGRTQIKPLLAHEKAAFGELTGRFFGDSLELTVGARYYRTLLDAQVKQSGAIIPIYYQRSSVEQRYLDPQKGISPKVSILWRITDDILTYATVARGFQFGGVNQYVPIVPTDTIPPTYRSSRVLSHEAGVRVDWLERKLRTDLTAFYIDWTDAQLNQSTPTLIQTPYIDNVGKVKSRGLESTVSWLTPIPGVKLDVAASYIIAKTAAPYESGARMVPTGSDMPAAPRLQTATTLGYANNFGAWLANAQLVHSYQGKAWSSIFQDHRIYGYHLFNLNLSVARPDWRYAPALTLGITNLTDERGVLGRSGTGTSDPNIPDDIENQVPKYTGIFSFFNRPRAVSLRLTAEF